MPCNLWSLRKYKGWYVKYIFFINVTILEYVDPYMNTYTLKITTQLHLQISVYLVSNKFCSLRRVIIQVTLLMSG